LREVTRGKPKTKATTTSGGIEDSDRT